MLKLNANGCSVVIEDDSPYISDSPDNVRHYAHEIRLDSGSAYRASSRHSVTVLKGTHVSTSIMLLAGGGASMVHEHSAIVIGDACFVAVGPYVVSLALPTLDLRWSTETDTATCFGVYYSHPHGLLVSHGELEIAALRLDGTLLWSHGGEDIFTNGIELRDNTIRVLDFNDRAYDFNIVTGAETAG